MWPLTTASDPPMKNFGTILCAALLAASHLPAQGEKVRRAILIEEKERDRQAAQALYAKIVADPATSAEDRTWARYRLGRLLRELGEEAKGTAQLELAAQGMGDGANAARGALSEKPGAARRVQAVRERAAAILGEWEAKYGSRGLGEEQNPQHYKELQLLGPEIIPVLIEVESKRWRKGLAGLQSLLWKIGGRHASTYIEAALKAEDPGPRHALLAGLPRSSVPGGMHQLAAKVLLHPLARPQATASWEHGMQAVALWLPSDSLLRVLEGVSPELQVKIWQGALRQRVQADPALLEQLAGPVRRALAHPKVASAATVLLCEHGSKSASLTPLLLELLPSLPLNVFVTWPQHLPQGMHAEITAVVEALTRCGRKDKRHDKRLAGMSGWLQGVWNAQRSPQLESLVRLLALGHEINGVQTHSHLVYEQILTRNDLETVLKPLFDSPYVRNAWPLLEGARRRGKEPGRLPASLWPLMKPHLPRQIHPHQGAHLLNCVAATGTAGAQVAIANLTATAGNSLEVSALTQALLYIHRLRDDEASRLALLEVLRVAIEDLQVGSDGTGLQVPLVQAAAEIIRLGMPQVIPLLQQPSALKNWSRISSAVGIQGGTFKHLGFTPEDLARLAVGMLRADPAHLDRQDWLTYLLAKGPGPQYEGPAIHALVTALLDELEDPVAPSVVPPSHRSKMIGALLGCLAHKTWANAHPQLTKRLQRFRLRLLRSGNWKLQQIALMRMGSPSPQEREQVLRLCRVPSFPGARAAFRAAFYLLNMSAAEFESLIRDVRGASNEIEGLRAYLRANPTRRLSAATLRVLLERGAISARIEICKELIRYDEDVAIPFLIEALRSPYEEVRTAARDSLDTFREFLTQRSFWQDTAGAHGIDATSAAKALLAQAARDQDKATRLLAIRALGRLDKPEVQPFLIEFSKEPDEDIQQAARQALARIAGLPAEKK